MLMDELNDLIALIGILERQLLVHDSLALRIHWIRLSEVWIVTQRLVLAMLRRQPLQIGAQTTHEAACKVGRTEVERLGRQITRTLELVDGRLRGLRRLLWLRLQSHKLLQLADPREEADQEGQSTLEPSISRRVGCHRDGLARLRTEAEVRIVTVRSENLTRFQQNSVEGDACLFERRRCWPPLLPVDEQLASRDAMLRTECCPIDVVDVAVHF